MSRNARVSTLATQADLAELQPLPSWQPVPFPQNSFLPPLPKLRIQPVVWNQVGFTFGLDARLHLAAAGKISRRGTENAISLKIRSESPPANTAPLLRVGVGRPVGRGKGGGFGRGVEQYNRNRGRSGGVGIVP
ncbi:unnamed protein product [Calypogeia fissa]